MNEQNQFSIFDMLEEMSQVQSITFAIPPMIKEEKDDEFAEYLYRGERILSLLREKQEKGMVHYDKCDFFEKLNLTTYQSCKTISKKFDYLITIATKVVRGLWESKDEHKEDHPLIQLLSEYVDINLSSVVAKSDPDSIANHLTGSKTRLYKGCVKLEGAGGKEYDDLYIPYGEGARLPKTKHRRSYSLKRKFDYYRFADAGLYFSNLYLLCLLKKQVKEEIRELNETQLEDNILYRFLLDEIKRLSLMGAKPILRIGKKLLEKNFIVEFIKKESIEYEVCSKDYSGLHYFLPLWFFSDEKLPHDIFYEVVTFTCGLTEKVLGIYEQHRATQKFMDSLKEEYAKSYQTKKNIPLKFQEAMTASKFNEYFGYVEIDEDCDLELFKTIEYQFEALAKVIFKGIKKEEVSIRFKKLGHYRAGGLYFPFLKCLCVDVRSASSLAHEYFHMLDYENGSISNGYSFSIILYKYRTCLDNYMNSLSEDHLQRVRWEGKTKYNKAYYYEPTEVFARCGELYLTRVLKVNNALVKANEECSFAYPDDEELMSLIKDFYDKFIQEID